MTKNEAFDLWCKENCSDFLSCSYEECDCSRAFEAGQQSNQLEIDKFERCNFELATEIVGLTDQMLKVRELLKGCLPYITSLNEMYTDKKSTKKIIKQIREVLGDEQLQQNSVRSLLVDR